MKSWLAMAQDSKITIIYDTPIKQLPQRTAKKIGIDEITESFQDNNRRY
jgi:hypothetical protein